MNTQMYCAFILRSVLSGRVSGVLTFNLAKITPLSDAYWTTICFQTHCNVNFPPLQQNVKTAFECQTLHIHHPAQ